MASLAVGFATLQNGSGFIICLHGLLQFTTLIAFMSRYPPLYIDSLARSVLFSSPALTLSYFAGIYSFDGHLTVEYIANVSALYFAQYFIAVISDWNTVTSLPIGIKIFVLVLGS